MPHLLRRTGRLVCAGLAATLLLLPGLTTAAYAQTPIPEVSESDPNNRLSLATEIPATAQVRGSIEPARDVDFYTFTVAQRGELQIRIGDVAAHIDTVLRVFNADAWQMGEFYAAEKGAGTAATIDLTEPGRYYLQLQDVMGDDASLQAYAMALTFTPALDTDEPNNRRSAATRLEIDTPHAATIFPKGDHDWYTFDLPQDGELRISVTETASDLGIIIQVFNPDAWPMTGDWIRPAEEGGDIVAALDVPEGGRYTVQVVDDFDDARSLQPYTIEIGFAPAVDRGEPNNRPSTATPLESGTPHPATIFPKVDHDWYRLDVAGFGQLEIAIIDVPAGLALQCQVFNPDMWSISGWLSPEAAGGDTVATLDLPEAGRYYLMVTDDYDDGRSLEPYTITATFTPGVAP